MALLKLVYRNQLFPRDAYRQTFERLLDAMGERAACRQAVELLSIAHERACEAVLAELLADGLAAGRLEASRVSRRLFGLSHATISRFSMAA